MFMFIGFDDFLKLTQVRHDLIANLEFFDGFNTVGSMNEFARNKTPWAPGGE